MVQRSVREVDERIERLELPFNPKGLDPYGISREHLRLVFRGLWWVYHYYFRVRAFGIENVPSSGRAMIVCNHSGGYAIDAAMLVGACFFEMERPRLAQGMAEKFLTRLPFVAAWTSKTGHVAGLPEHAERLLEDERLLMIFPEGARGTAKLFKDRYSLVRFGTGFLRLALRTRSPIIPAAFLGGGEAVPTVANLYKLGRLMGVPYIPITPYLLPTPLPVRLHVRFGPALHFEGSGDEDDAFVESKVEQVKESIAGLISEGRKHRADE
jgi:1-acyl-sn-glycerol-3-phosphate acyltransferase